MAPLAFSQTQEPATAAYPDPGQPPAAPMAATDPGPPAPQTSPPPAPPAPPAAQTGAPPPQAAPAEPNGYNQGDYDQDGYNVGRSGIVEPPPPPPPEDKGFELPDMSVRVDPLNWIIYGRLGIELEATVYKFITAEVIPVFVTDSQPPFMNLGSLPATLYQNSNGLGAMSGASIGAGFWLNGNPFRGTVLRFYYTNYGYRYTSKDDGGAIIDEASHTERRLVAFIGSHSKWGVFTIASGIGLGMELNRERRCFVGGAVTTSGCSKDVFELGLTRSGPPVSLYGALHPTYLLFRLSLGFVF